MPEIDPMPCPWCGRVPTVTELGEARCRTELCSRIMPMKKWNDQRGVEAAVAAERERCAKSLKNWWINHYQVYGIGAVDKDDDLQSALAAIRDGGK